MTQMVLNSAIHNMVAALLSPVYKECGLDVFNSSVRWFRHITWSALSRHEPAVCVDGAGRPSLDSGVVLDGVRQNISLTELDVSVPVGEGASEKAV